MTQINLFLPTLSIQGCQGTNTSPTKNETLKDLSLVKEESNPRYTLDLLIQEHEQIECETRARGRRGNKGVTRRHGAQEDEDESRSPNVVDETQRSSVESFKTPRSTPDLNLEGIGWVERLREGEA
jgi:hypothetical protein